MAKQSIRQPIKLIALALIALLALVSQSLVMAQSSTSRNEVEVVGTVTALTNQTLTLGTQTFDISQAEVKAGVAVGKRVKIHATPNTAGQWVVREVELVEPALSPTIVPQPQTTPDPEATVEPTPTGEFEVTGVVTALTDTSVTVGGQVIDIANAEVKDSFTVNSLIKIHVSVVNGVWVAREVELASTTIPGNPTLVPTRQGNNGRNGNDDGPGHDTTDDHGNHNGNDDGGNHSGNDDSGHHGGDDNGGDDNGGNSGNSGSGGGNGSGGHGHG